MGALASPAAISKVGALCARIPYLWGVYKGAPPPHYPPLGPWPQAPRMLTHPLQEIKNNTIANAVYLVVVGSFVYGFFFAMLEYFCIFVYVK